MSSASVVIALKGVRAKKSSGPHDGDPARAFLAHAVPAVPGRKEKMLECSWQSQGVGLVS